MLKTLLLPLTLQLLLLSSSDSFVSRVQTVRTDFQTGTLQKMMLVQGSVTLELDLHRLNGLGSRSQTSKLHFGVAPDSFFSILVYNDALRGPLPGTMALVPQNLNVPLPTALNAATNRLVLEKTGWNNPFEWVIRDSTSGFVYFNVEGINDDYDSKAQVLSLKEGRLLVSKEFAAKLGRPSEERSIVGMLSLSATMRAIEITQVVNGEAKSASLPPVSPNSEAPTQVSGPDVIVGDLPSLVQSGSSGTQVGLTVATTSCNLGTVELDWFQLPNNDHPVIPQNLYRLSGGANNDDRFEQIGQSWLKHAFNALQESFCSTCIPAANGTHLGAGCSDPYTTSLNGSQSSLGSRAWVNPFTGFFPGSSPNPNDHTGHTHTGTSHRILVEVADLDTTLNPGATYYAEAQYVTPHEYTWCQSHAGQCNMYNNASYRRFNVSGSGNFTFSSVGSTQQTKPAITGWPGASNVTIEPAPGIDGTGIVASKVTNPSPGVWHYEYAVYNQNLDRGIQSFSVPLPPGINVSNIGFHGPPQPAAFPNDGTAGDAGYSSAAWTVTQAADSLTWSSETFATNQNANAIRWGTLYNFRFDADGPPRTLNGTVGFFKTGPPISAQVQGPGGGATISVNDVAVTEGNSGTTLATFAVTLSASSAQTITVQYATADKAASAGSDYVSTSGTLTFTPGQTSQPVTVIVNGDTLNEANETFFLNLSNATNASISDTQAIGTITNDDPLPSLSIDDVSVIEGNAGTTAAVFTASLSAVSGQTVTVNFSTTDGSASSSSDYIPLLGTLTIGPGFTGKTFIISINGDTTIEPDETFLVNLSGATNALIADGQGQGTIVNDDFPAPAFEFTQANFDNPEGTSSLLVTVKRTGNPAPAASVDFQTNDSTSFVECNAVTGIANQRCDYLSTNGTLSFGANEVEKSFPVIVYNDLYQEGNETIGLSLINPSSGTLLGTQSTATITILDNDSGTPGTNPIDSSQFFVQQHYFDFLQRTPDQAGLDFWVETINSCGADPVCINNRRISVSDAFFFEAEYQQTAAYVVRLYRTAFGNNQPFPNPSTGDLVEAKKLIDYSVFARDRARVVGGSNLAQAQLDLANAFVQRPEFLTKYPASLTGPQFVDAVVATIQNDLGVDMNSQRTALISLFNSGGRGTVMFRLSDDDTGGNPINNRALIDAEYNRTFVFTEYAGYLRRNADINGFKFWLGQVNAFPVRNLNIQHAMVCSFITSQEYQQRFSSVVTRTNASCQ